MAEEMERYNPKDDPAVDLSGYSDRFRPFEKPTAEVNVGFHGSNRGLVGDQIRPDIGRQNAKYDISGQRHINYWSSPSGKESAKAEEQAWDWAGGGSDTVPEHDPSLGRSRVHEVRARGLPGPDANLPHLTPSMDLSKMDMPAPVAATHADVTRTLWTPPPNQYAAMEGKGVQGTLPHINWSQFGAPNVGNPEDAYESYQAGSSTTMTAYHQQSAERHYAKSQAEARASWNAEPQGQIPGQTALFGEPQGPSAYQEKVMRDSASKRPQPKLPKPAGVIADDEGD